jgi:hypothetical protein
MLAQPDAQKAHKAIVAVLAKKRFMARLATTKILCEHGLWPVNKPLSMFLRSERQSVRQAGSKS